MLNIFIQASPIWKGPTIKVWESSIEPNVEFISQTEFEFPYSLDECKEYCQERNDENRCNAIKYNSVNQTCALLSFPYAIPNPDLAFNDTYIQMVFHENWKGYYLVNDDAIPQKGIVTQISQLLYFILVYLHRY